MTIAVIYVFLAIGLGASLIKDRRRTARALHMARKMLLKMLPSLVAVIGLVGLIVGLVPEEVIHRYLGPEAGLLAVLAASVVGAISLLPALVSFPLAASLMRSGATITSIAAFITTLTMVGVVTAPLEIRELGRRFTIVRNTLSFAFALVIAALMGAILS